MKALKTDGAADDQHFGFAFGQVDQLALLSREAQSAFEEGACVFQKSMPTAC